MANYRVLQLREPLTTLEPHSEGNFALQVEYQDGGGFYDLDDKYFASVDEAYIDAQKREAAKLEEVLRVRRRQELIKHPVAVHVFSLPPKPETYVYAKSDYPEAHS